MNRRTIILIVGIIFFIIGWQANIYFTPKAPLPKKIELKKSLTLLEKIIEKKQLDVVILNSPTTYYVGAVKEVGFEYELIKEYSKHIGVDLNLTVVHTVNEALELSRKGIGDITVAGLTTTDERKKKFKFGPQYYTIQEQLICNQHMYRDKTIPRDVEDLLGLNILVGEETSYAATLNKIADEVEGMEFNTTSEYSTEQLLELVNSKKIDCTVADSNIFMVNQRFYPELVRTLVLGDRENLAWILREGDDSLNDSLYKWINSYERSGKMAQTRDFYYSFLTIFDYYDTKVFYKHMKNRLPKYEKYFKDAGKKYDVPWLLLAAQSYQESHWNPRAKSHTGVRGMMMLTRSTAKQIGVKNRLNAKESIFGGAKYLRMMEKRFPPEIKGKNRWAFTLAAYNVGMGHIHDAQMLARKLNKDPYSWSDVKKILPLLSQKKYYKTLKYGYARGDEPVRYLNSILNYLNIIHQEELKKSK